MKASERRPVDAGCISFGMALLLAVILIIQTGDAALSSSERTDMVTAHNNARAIAQPTPCPALPAVTWDSTLASVAQSYADRCIYEHNPQRKTQTNGAFASVGENLFIHTNTGVNPVNAVTSWDSEKSFYTLSSNSCQPGKICGHYTQIVWASSVNVGCGSAVCAGSNTQSYPFDASRFPNAVIIVCNYGPAGNYVGTRPYTACPAGATPAPLTTAFAPGSPGRNSTQDGSQPGATSVPLTTAFAPGSRGRNGTQDGSAANSVMVLESSHYVRVFALLIVALCTAIFA